MMTTMRPVNRGNKEGLVPKSNLPDMGLDEGVDFVGFGSSLAVFHSPQ